MTQWCGAHHGIDFVRVATQWGRLHLTSRLTTAARQVESQMSATSRMILASGGREFPGDVECASRRRALVLCMLCRDLL